MFRNKSEQYDEKYTIKGHATNIDREKGFQELVTSKQKKHFDVLSSS